MTSILVTDCGSTTTKAILIEERGGEFRLAGRGEAPTTVEAPVEDVTRGVLNSAAELEERVGRRLLDQNTILKSKNQAQGVDLYLSTSSAGGGLQMVVAGVVKEISGQSAARAALGAGAIVVDVVATNDGRLPHERIERIRAARPDMILLSGGMEGGTVSHVAEMAQLIAAGSPKPRFGADYRLPVIYAGNQEARPNIEKILDRRVALQMTENLRPSDKMENLGPTRQCIQTLFLEHVMAHAPGYTTLMQWTDAPIMPTPAAVGKMMQQAAESKNMNVLGADIGGATTDVFSVFNRIFNRTVSANLGMSYSISNVLAEAGIDNIRRWIPFEISERELRNFIQNKMIRPTTIPMRLRDLIMEHAVSREALRLSFEQHKMLAVDLKGAQKDRTIADAFAQSNRNESLVNLMDLNMLIGSGGVLSHAPRRAQAALMMMDAFQPEGLTALTVDSIFMMPHLGVLSEVNLEAALQVFEKDCLVWLGTCIAPVGESKPEKVLAEIQIKLSNQTLETLTLQAGELKILPMDPNETSILRIKPSRGINAGKGEGVDFEAAVKGGAVGLILDGRGRPIKLPNENSQRVDILNHWNASLQAYPF